MSTVKINNTSIGDNNPVYIVAELSANHAQKLDNAIKLIHMAKRAGADAIKIQTYTADTLTIDSDRPEFRISDGLWKGQTLYGLYQSAYTPWEWTEPLINECRNVGLTLISTTYDRTSTDFLEEVNIPAYKIASFELNDIPLIRYVASKGKPMIMSTGMASAREIQDAVKACKDVGNTQIILLKCTSAYPAPINEMNLNRICNLIEVEGIPIVVGLSDHSLSIVPPIVATTLGAKVIEKHMTIDRSSKTPDSEFSLEPKEFAGMVRCVREAEQALGSGLIEIGKQEQKSLKFRRSLFIIKDMHKGDKFSEENIRSIRPSDGQPPMFYDSIIGKTCTCDIARGTPLSWRMIKTGDSNASIS